MSPTIKDLSCKIFVDADVAQPGLAELLSDGANTQVLPRPSSLLIMNDIGEWELRRNDDRDREAAQEFPDGFLHFRSVIEFYPRMTASRDDEVNDIARLLDRLWSSGMPAVASCDYEGELPHHGGYRDPTLPWPSAPQNGLNDDSGPVELGVRDRPSISST